MQSGVRGASAWEGESETRVRLDEASARDAAERVLAAWQRSQQAQAAFSAELQRFYPLQAYTVDGSLSTRAWLRNNLHMTPNQAAQQLTVARELDQLPETKTAFQSAQISYSHAAVIASCARKLGGAVVAEHEQTLLECAKQVDPFSLGKVTDHLQHCVDPDGSLSFFERQHERRTLQLQRHQDGMYSLRGIFDCEGGAVIASGLEALMPPPVRSDWRSDWRSAGQRRADALVESFQQQAESPQLTVICEPGTLRRQPGSPAGELRDQLTVPAEVVRRIACECSLQEGHVCADGVNVHLGRRSRVVPPRLRRQLELRDAHCRYPGCDRPASWTDAHHLRHWADGGPTVLSNLVLLCRLHHRAPHEHGWTLKWDEHGELLAQPP